MGALTVKEIGDAVDTELKLGVGVLDLTPEELEAYRLLCTKIARGRNLGAGQSKVHQVLAVVEAVALDHEMTLRQRIAFYNELFHEVHGLWVDADAQRQRAAGVESPAPALKGE